MKVIVYIVSEHDWYEYQGICLVTANEDVAMKECEKMGRSLDEYEIEVDMNAKEDENIEGGSTGA